MKNDWKSTFAIIWSGQFFSILSSAVVGYAVVFWLSLETGSAEILATAAIASLLPQSRLGFFVGVYIDRWDRKRTMILADCFIALCTLLLAISFWTDHIVLWEIYLLLVCRSVGSAFHMPAMQASVPLLAPESQLTRIAGIDQMIESVSRIAGPALGALLLAWTGMGTILLLDVAGAAIACITLLFVRIPNPQRAPGVRPHLLREMREGLQAIRTVKGLGWLFLLAVSATFFIMPVGVMFPLMTLSHFGGDAMDMSIVEMLWGGGALAGGAIMGLRRYRINQVLLINAMYGLLGVCFIASGLLSPQGFVFFAILSAIEGIAGSVYRAAFVAVVQTVIDPSLLGRVLSLYFSLNLLPSVLGLLGTGFLAGSVVISRSFVISGALVCTIGVLSFLLPSLSRLGRKVAAAANSDPSA